MKAICFTCVLSLIGFILYCSPEGIIPYERKHVLPEHNISYYDDLLPMFDDYCGWECHSSVTEIILPFQDKDDFINYRLSFTGDVLVDTLLHKIDPTRAPLYRIVTQFDYLGNNDIMPPLSAGRPPLTDNQINGIKQWIAEGAPD
jgi:hypothetical protein